ncbi:MAG: cation:proton antiporter [Proteobacteria bacterium]|nr:cation:proton antiporter [Pseudomonadota bacterium]
MTLIAQSCALLAGAWLLAWFAARLKLPSLMGMIAAGAIMAAFPLPALDSGPVLSDVSPTVRLAVLAVVLLRAGLSVSGDDMRTAGKLAVAVGLIPMLCDGALVALASVYLLDFPVPAAIVLGFLIAPISPAIVITGLLDLLDSLHGRARRAPTALLAGAPLDNIAAVVALGIAVDIATRGDVTWTSMLVELPYTLAIGIAVGVATGWIFAASARRFPGWAAHPTAVVAVWAAAGLLIWAGEQASFSFVLAIIALGATVRAMVAQAAEALGNGLRRVWNSAQYALFGLIGLAVDIDALAAVGLAAVGVIALGQLGRATGALLATLGSGLSGRERAACILSYMPKASIQAVFSGLALDRGLAEGEVILSTGVLAIVIATPIGLIALHHGVASLLGARRSSG